MPDHSDQMLELRSLNLARGKRKLLTDVTLDLPGKGITVIMGPNGAGKSVLLKLIHGLEQPDLGTVRWGGAVIDDQLRRKQSMVFQRPVLLRRTVLENMTFVMKCHGIADRSRADELLSLVNLEERLHQPARRLSGGEQQRLALARALLTRPEVLLLDEPTASLDPGSANTIENVIRAQKSDGTAIILITHDGAQARRLADEVVFMHQGRIVEYAPAETFFDAPTSDEARRYLNGDILI